MFASSGAVDPSSFAVAALPPLRASFAARSTDVLSDELTTLAPCGVAACLWVRAACLEAGRSGLAFQAFALQRAAVLDDVDALHAFVEALSLSPDNVVPLVASLVKRCSPLQSRTAVPLLSLLMQQGEAVAALSLLPMLPSGECEKGGDTARLLMEALSSVLALSSASTASAHPPLEAAFLLHRALCDSAAADADPGLRATLLAVSLARDDGARFASLIRRCSAGGVFLPDGSADALLSRCEQRSDAALTSGDENLSQLWNAAAHARCRSA